MYVRKAMSVHYLVVVQKSAHSFVEVNVVKAKAYVLHTAGKNCAFLKDLKCVAIHYIAPQDLHVLQTKKRAYLLIKIIVVMESVVRKGNFA